MQIFSTILVSIVDWEGRTGAQQRSSAGFQACNPTGCKLEVAKVLGTGVNDGTSPTVISEVWFKLPPNASIFLSSGRRQHDRNLLYAQDGVSKRGVTGAGPVSVGPRTFTIQANAHGTSHQRQLVSAVDMGRPSGRPDNFTS